MAISILGKPASPSGIDLKKQYEAYKTLTPGKMARVVSNGKASDLPLGQMGLLDYANCVAGFRPMQSVLIEENKALVLGSLEGNTTLACALVSVDSNNEVSIGTVVTIDTDVFNLAGYGYWEAKKLASGSVIVGYAKGASAALPYAAIIQSSGLTATVGTPQQLHSTAKAYHLSIGVISPTSAIIGFANNVNSSYGTLIAVSTSGTSISYGSATTFNSVLTNTIKFSESFSTNKILLVAYFNPNEVYAVLLTVTGTTVTVGNNTVIDAGAASNPIIKKATETVFITFNEHQSNSEGRVSSIIYDPGANTISRGALMRADTSGYYLCDSQYSEIWIKDSTTAYVCWLDRTNNTWMVNSITYGTTGATATAVTVKLPRFTVSSGAIPRGTSYVGNGLFAINSSSEYDCITIVDAVNNKIVNQFIHYEVNSSYIVRPLPTTNGNIIIFGFYTTGFRASTINPNEILGLTDGVIGLVQGDQSVMIQGISTSHAGLIPGKKYTYNRFGELIPYTGAVGEKLAGMALSASELLINSVTPFV